MIPEKEKQFITYWENTRLQGRWIYAFKRGLLTFSWPVYLGSELFKYFTSNSRGFNLSKFMMGFIIWTVLGFLAFGLLMWYTQEKKYQNMKKKEGN